MIIQYDKEADAIYIYTGVKPPGTAGVAKRTDGYWPIFFDYTKENKLYGIEILDASTFFHASLLDSLSWEEQPVTRDLLDQMMQGLEKSNPSDPDEQDEINRLLKILRREQAKVSE